MRGPRRRKRTNVYKETTFSSPAPPFSTPMRVTPSELPLLRRSSSCKRPDRWNPPATALLANTHKMSMERRKQQRHDAPPSRIDAVPYRSEILPVPAVRSPCLHATAPTQDQICRKSGQICTKRGRYRGIPSANDKNHRLHGPPRAIRRCLTRWCLVWVARTVASLRFGRPRALRPR